MSKIINDGLDQYDAVPFNSSNLEQLTLNGLILCCVLYIRDVLIACQETRSW